MLGLWPSRDAASPPPRARRARRRPSRLGADDDQAPVEAPDRARRRSTVVHHWPGEIVFEAGTRRAVARGEWRLTLGPTHRQVTERAPVPPALDPARPERMAAELESLLTLQLPGTRLSVTHVDDEGWRELELRLPSQPETVVQLDRAAVARVFGGTPDTVRVTMHVRA